MLRLKPTNVTPPDKYRFKFPDGNIILAIGYDEWLEKIRKYATDNNYPIPTPAECESQFCALLPPGWCRYDDGSEPNVFINRRFTLDDAVNGTKVLIEFIKQGAPLVSQEEAEERGKTCAACYAALDIPGCRSCSAFANYVAEVAGARTTKADVALDSKVCGVCGCSAIANLWIPVEVSKSGVTSEMMQLWPDFCWKGKSLRELAK